MYYISSLVIENVIEICTKIMSVINIITILNIQI